MYPYHMPIMKEDILIFELQAFAWFCERFPATLQPPPVKTTGLTATETRVLLAIADFSITTTRELMALCHWDKSLVSRFLHQLDLKDLLEYQRRPGNRRFMDFQLTDKGKKLAAACKAARDQHVRELLQEMSDRQMEEMLRGMSDVRGRLSGVGCRMSGDRCEVSGE